MSKLLLILVKIRSFRFRKYLFANHYVQLPLMYFSTSRAFFLKKPFLIFPSILLLFTLFNCQTSSQIPTLVRFPASRKVSPASGLLLFPKTQAFSGALRLYHFQKVSDAFQTSLVITIRYSLITNHYVGA